MLSDDEWDRAEAKAKKLFPSIPNLRAAECCGTCEHWVWGCEGEGDCKKFSTVTVDDVEFNRLILDDDDTINATDICDLWTKEDQ